MAYFFAFVIYFKIPADDGSVVVLIRGGTDKFFFAQPSMSDFPIDSDFFFKNPFLPFYQWLTDPCSYYYFEIENLHISSLFPLPGLPGRRLC
jgi:hypothetical protein